MVFKRIVSSPKLYVILLIFAMALLVFIGSVSYKQITEFKEAGNLVTHTIEVEKEINILFSIYAQMESAQLKNLLRKDTVVYASTFQKYIQKANKSIDSLEILIDDNTVQQTHLIRIKELQQDLITALKTISDSPKTSRKFSSGERSNIDSVGFIMAELNQRKNFMLNKEQMLLKERKAAYNSYAFFTPIMILLLGMFALFVFVVSFLKINTERKNRSKAEAFLESVMSNTENIINFYEPIFKNDEVVDFRLVYANARNKIDFDVNPKDIIGKPISKIFPFVLLNGEYEKLASSYNDKKTHKLNRQVQVNGKKIWLESIIKPLSDGILVIAKNITNEKESVVRLNDLNDKLQLQYAELQSTEAFLQSILKSTSNVIAHYKPITNSDNKIIDFSIAYTNEVIRSATGEIPEEIKGKKISEVFPYIMDNGIFDTMVQTYLTGETLKLEKEYIIQGETKVFLSTATKSENGVTLTSRENTLERRAEKQMIELNEQLKIQNTILKEAKAIAKIGSYSWNFVHEDLEKAKISDNLYHLLDSEPDDFLGTHRNFKKFIHPDDLEYYELSLKQALEKNSPIDFNYRVITKTNKTKHFRTVGNIQGNMLTGVIQDVTNIIKGEQKIKEKNQELKRSNEELESFNRVASHDLQEPIRKIQMFISRIAEADLDKLSDKSKAYFAKINSSSDRMRMLIKYLLSYSRINKTKKDFDKVNLSVIIEKVQEDLDTRIKESGATIVVDNLPILNAIPFQMEQLFNNLLSNAIKYRGMEDPKIIIDCKKLKRNEITDNFIKKSKAYYRISVLDNGIGFAQEHSEKIFELFQRLHQNDEYSGTGIGLAICKKIVQNHSGYILAESEPGKGSSFCIYLPA